MRSINILIHISFIVDFSQNVLAILTHHKSDKEKYGEEEDIICCGFDHINYFRI